MNAFCSRPVAAVGALLILGLTTALLSPRAKSAGGPVAVQVANTLLPASDIDGGVRHPVVVSVNVSVPVGADFAVVSYTVPAHQRLVVHSVNAEMTNSDTTFPPANVTLSAHTAGTTNYLYYPFNTAVGALYFCNQPTALVADAGSTVQIEVDLSALVTAGGHAYGGVSLLGYLEPES